MDGDNIQETGGQETGGVLLQLPNGALYDKSIGRIVKAPPPERQPINQENARDFHALARAKRIEIAQRGIELGTGATRWDVGAVDIIAAQSRLALDISKGRGSTEAARLVLGAAELLPDRSQADGGGPAVRLELSQGAVESLAGLLGGVIAAGQVDASDNYSYTKHGEVIDVGAVDGESQAEIAEVGCDECE